MPGDDCRFWRRLIADKGIGLQLAVSGLLCQRQKSGSFDDKPDILRKIHFFSHNFILNDNGSF